jgi:hypothetical protein
MKTLVPARSSFFATVFSPITSIAGYIDLTRATLSFGPIWFKPIHGFATREHFSRDSPQDAIQVIFG